MDFEIMAGKFNLVCGALVLGSLFMSPIANAQMSTQDAHNQGINFGTQKLNEKGTDDINEQTANQIPLYKKNPTQQSDYQGGVGDMMSIGTSRITQSKSYSSGNCDRESFNPEQVAISVKGVDAWNKMSAAEKQRAINTQKAYFDQECEGINFLSGEYGNRTQIDLSDDDLSNWAPSDGNPDDESLCSVENVSIPAEYVSEMCYESTAIEKKQCFDRANVNVFFTEVMEGPPITYTFHMDYSAPSWEVTVYPDKGIVEVTAPRGCLPGFLGVPSALECKEGNYGRVTETISMFGGRTNTFQLGENYDKYDFRSAHVSNNCIFRMDNWHYQGGGASGSGHSHEEWRYNFCVRKKHVEVSWVNDCSLLEAAVNK